MFVPTGNIYPPVSTSLVATTVPNSAVLRVPSGNVAPSVSSAEVEDNARGNRHVPSRAQGDEPVATSATTGGASVSIPAGAVGGAAGNGAAVAVQSAFLAQLAGQDGVSSETQGIFVQYEKLVNYGTVKYKPSNAGKPTPPVNLFSAFLQQETAGEAVPSFAMVDVVPAVAAEALPSQAPQPEPVVQPEQAGGSNVAAPVFTVSSPPAGNTVDAFTRAIIGAYDAATRRVDMLTAPQQTASA